MQNLPKQACSNFKDNNNNNKKKNKNLITYWVIMFIGDCGLKVESVEF